MSRNVTMGIWAGAIIVALYFLVRYGGGLVEPFLVEEEALDSPKAGEVSPAMEGGRAPYFELSDLSGNRVRLSDVANTPLLITFWTSRENDAADQIKILDDWLMNRRDALVTLMTVNNQEDRSAVKSFVERGSYAVPVLIDAEGVVGKAYGIQTLPVTFFVDRDGVIREVHVGIMSQAMIEEKSEKLLR